MENDNHNLLINIVLFPQNHIECLEHFLNRRILECIDKNFNFTFKKNCCLELFCK